MHSAVVKDLPLSRRLIAATVATLALSGMLVTSARAGAVPFVFNGTVDKVVPAGDYTYVAGTFTKQLPATGGGLVIPAAGKGTINPKRFAHVAGSVTAAVADGAGGWFVAGQFQQVGAFARDGLAHVNADGSVDPAWEAPELSSGVASMVASGGTLYVNVDNGAPVTALSRKTGKPTGWNPSADGTVVVRAATGRTVYVTGTFTHIGGQERSGLAAIDARTGAATAWNPGPDGAVQHLAVTARTVYLAGRFTHVGGRARSGLAALDPTTGAARAFNPRPDRRITSLIATTATVYVGGAFGEIGGKRRLGVAALDPRTGRAMSWNPAHRGKASLLQVSGGRVYLDRVMHNRVGHASSLELVAVDGRTGTETQWRPAVGGGSSALEPRIVAVSDRNVYVGGQFAGAGHPLATLGQLARLRSDGSLDTSWRPRFRGKCLHEAGLMFRRPCVKSLAASARTVYVGGWFSHVGGHKRPGLGAISTTTARVTGWNPQHAGTAYPVLVDGDAVYVNGDFSHVGGQPRRQLAALSATTGRATAWNPQPNGPVTHLVSAGAALYATGAFTQIGGQPRAGIAAFDARSGLISAWNPPSYGEPGAITASAGSVFVGYRTASLPTIVGLDAGTGATRSTLLLPDPVMALASSSDTVYAAGGFTQLVVTGSTFFDRLNLMAFDARTMAVTAWDPHPGTHLDGGEGFVGAVAVSDRYIYAAGGGLTKTRTAVTGPLVQVDPATGLAVPTTIRR